MRFRNALKIVFSNFGLVYRSMLYRAVVFILTVGLLAAFVLPRVNYVLVEVGGSYFTSLFESFSGLVKGFFTGSDKLVDLGKTLEESVVSLGSYLKMNSAKLILPSILTIVIVWIAYFFNGLSNFALGELIYEYMSSLTHGKFLHCFFKNFGRACLYQVVAIAVNVLNLILINALLFVIMVYGIKILSFFALPLAVLIIVIDITVKRTLFDSYLPEIIVNGSSIKKASSVCFQIGKKERMKGYGVYFAVSIMAIYINISIAVWTATVGLLLTIPLTYLLFLCLKFVNYYTRNKKKYYVHFDSIVVPVELRGEDTNLLSNMID